MPVVICRTGAPLRASRAASFSVARSPTSAATRYRGCKRGQRLLQQRRLAGAGARDQADHEDARLAEPLPQLARDQVVLLEDVLPHLDEARLVAHCSISRATSSSSLPRSTCGVGVPHSAQQNDCTLLSSRSAAHCGQIDHDGHLLDHQPRSLQRSLGAGHLVRGQQRLGHDAGQGADAKVQRAHAAARAVSASSWARSTRLSAIESSCMVRARRARPARG